MSENKKTIDDKVSCGILFSDGSSLYYLPDLHRKENILMLCDFVCGGDITAVYVGGEGIFVGIDSSGTDFNFFELINDKPGKIKDFRGKFASITRIAKVNDKIVVAGYYNTLTDEHGNQLIPYKKMKKRNIAHITDIIESDEGYYLSVIEDSGLNKIIKLHYDGKSLDLGEEVLNFKVRHSYPSRTYYIEEREDFLTTVHRDCLTLCDSVSINVIEGSLIKSKQFWWGGWDKLDIVSLDEKSRIVEVIVDGKGLGFPTAEYMKIDLTFHKVIQRNPLDITTTSFRIIKERGIHDLLIKAAELYQLNKKAINKEVEIREVLDKIKLGF